MAPDHSSAAPSSDGAGPLPATPTDARPGRAQHRVLIALAGLGVVALAGGTFVLTYEDLRALALAGGAPARWAPVYPVLVDVLITVTVLALVATRHARWWSRWPRWSLLLALVAGAAAAGVQRAVKGYEALPDDALKAGVAAAPYVMLVIVVWLWLAMFRQFHRSSRRAAPEPAPAVVDAPEPVEPPATPPLAITAARSDDTWLFDDAEGDDQDADHETQDAHRALNVPQTLDEPEPTYRAPAPSPDLSPRIAPLFDPPEHFPDDAPPFDPLPGDSPAFASPEPLPDDDPSWDSPPPEAPNSRQHSGKPLPGDTPEWNSPELKTPEPRHHSDGPPADDDDADWSFPEPAAPEPRPRPSKPLTDHDDLNWDSPQPETPNSRERSDKPFLDDDPGWDSSERGSPESRARFDKPLPGWDSSEPEGAGSRRHSGKPPSNGAPAWDSAESEGPLPGDVPARGPAGSAVPEPRTRSAEDVPARRVSEEGRGVDVDDDPTPPTGYPSLLPTDVELVRGRARTAVKPAATTRPDIVMPSREELAGGEPAAEPDPAEDGDTPVVDRAEDPDGGDDAPVPSSDDLVAGGEDGPAEPSPPSGSLRSSPTPPKD